MLHIYRSTAKGKIKELDHFTKGCWVNLINPSKKEIRRVVDELNIIPDFICDPLDAEERSRIEQIDNQLLIIVDIPLITRTDTAEEHYITLPIGMIVTKDYFVTVCLKPNEILDQFVQNRVKNFFTYMKTRFVLQILYMISTYYLNYLKTINQKTHVIEEKIRRSLKNQELFSLLQLEKSLVYFTISLKTNNNVTEKLLKGQHLKMYEADQHLLEDVIIENKQAIEMAEIYSSILNGLMDVFASVVSNNLNNVMKILASITIILTFPILIAGIYGMNVPLPFQNSSFAFTAIILLSLTLSSIAAFIFWKKRFL